jgi:creatinine amidohydrolase
MLHSFIPPHRYFAYLSWAQVAEMDDKENVVIIQPVGAIEQHGLHLPLAVDSVIALGVLGKALEMLDSAVPAYSLPMLYYGKSNEHSSFAGTIALSATTLTNILTEMAESLYRSGFRKLVFFNAHGGQPQVLQIIARDLHVKYPDLMIFPLFVWNVPNAAAELLSSKELALGIHAGDAETSLMLTLLPEQVNMDRAVSEYPQGLPQDSSLSMEGMLPFAWSTQDLSKSGVIGDATVATTEKGDRLLETLSSGWIRTIKDIYKFKQPSTDSVS